MSVEVRTEGMVVVLPRDQIDKFFPDKSQIISIRELENEITETIDGVINVYSSVDDFIKKTPKKTFIEDKNTSKIPKIPKIPEIPKTSKTLNISSADMLIGKPKDSFVFNGVVYSSIEEFKNRK